MDVGVSELKATLSAVLRRAASGELITVTNRGRPIAVLGPPPAAEQGWLTPASSAGLQPVRRVPARMSVLDALTQDRGG